MRTTLAIAVLSMILANAMSSAHAQQRTRSFQDDGTRAPVSVTPIERSTTTTATPANPVESIVEAVRAGDQDSAEYLLLTGSSANALSSDGDSLLWIAIGNNDESMVELLLEAGADADFRDPSGDQPLHIAARRDLVSIFELLLEAGADTSARSAAGETPLQITSSAELRELIAEAKATLRSSADPGDL